MNNPFAKIQRTYQTDTERLLALRLRGSNAERLSSADFRRAGAAMQLRPIQSWALHEIATQRGLIGAIGVGLGKTLIALLARTALRDFPRTLIIVPGALRQQFIEDRQRYSAHFEILPATLISYRNLSDPRNPHLLEQLAPRLIVCDEAHKLRNTQDATCVRRVLRYAKANPNAMWVLLSGTLTTRSVLDYAHLCTLALKERSPLPLRWAQLQSWAQVLDVQGRPLPRDFACVRPVLGENPRAEFERRFRSTPGVITTPSHKLRASLVIERRNVALPDAIAQMYADIEQKWEVAGFMFDSALRLADYLRQISQGFYYKWIWPNGPDYAWLDSRAAWWRAARKFLRLNRPGLDSPALLERACAAGMPPSSGLADAWASWQYEREKPAPPVEPVWISQFLVRDALQWLGESASPRLLWYAHDAIGEALRSEGVPVYGAGTQPPPAGERCALSIAAHGTGRNLQAWHRSLVLSPPANGAAWEQLLGRTHRTGQTADCVYWAIYQHTEIYRRALQSALADARYIHETTGAEQRLLYAARTT